MEVIKTPPAPSAWSEGSLVNRPSGLCAKCGAGRPGTLTRPLQQPHTQVPGPGVSGPPVSVLGDSVVGASATPSVPVCRHPRCGRPLRARRTLAGPRAPLPAQLPAPLFTQQRYRSPACTNGGERPDNAFEVGVRSPHPQPSCRGRQVETHTQELYDAQGPGSRPRAPGSPPKVPGVPGEHPQVGSTGPGSPSPSETLPTTSEVLGRDYVHVCLAGLGLTHSGQCQAPGPCAGPEAWRIVQGCRCGVS